MPLPNLEGCTDLHRSQGTDQQATKEEVPVINRTLRVVQMETQPAGQSGTGGQRCMRKAWAREGGRMDGWGHGPTERWGQLQGCDRRRAGVGWSEGTGGMGWRGTQDTQAWRLRGGGTTQDTGLAEASGQLGTEEMH